MTAIISFTVPGAPQGKGRARVVRIAGFTRMATPEKTVAYEGLIAQVGAQAMADHPPLLGPVALKLDIRLDVPTSWSRKKREAALAGAIHPMKKPDTDNVVKAIGDGLNGIAWKDDVQIVAVVACKRYAERPGVGVVIEAI